MALRLTSAACLAMLAAVHAQHDGMEEHAEENTHTSAEDSDHGEAVFVGGHLSARSALAACTPVVCDDDLMHHDAKDAQGCQNMSMFNFVKNRTETVLMTCQGCVPHTCDHGEHDCVPVYCDVGGEIHGGHSYDPCAQGHHGGDGLAWWPFLLCCLAMTVGVTGVLTKMGNGACCGRSFNPPFTVVMFFLGYIISSFVTAENVVTEWAVDTASEHLHFSEIVFESVVAWKGAHPHVILFVLLPPLLFEDASGMDYYVFRKVLMSSILLAGPGVGITMAACAGTTMLLFGFADECVKEIDHVTHAEREVCEEQLPIPVHLLLGGMLAATDPVAVCAVLNDLGCPDKLNFMIAGESLLNDGTAVVAFMVMQSVAGGCSTDAFGVAMSLLRLAGGGVLWGLFMSACAYQGIRKLRDPNIEITTLVFCTMATFWVAENIIGVSGVLGTVVFGVQTARTSFLAMDEHTHHANHAFWSEVGYVATSIIFILAGVKSRDKIARFIDEAAHTVDTTGTDTEFHMKNQMMLNLVLWFILTIIRAAVVFLMSPILTRIGYGLTAKEAAVMVWGGLRGAVSLSLALLVDGNHLIGARAREMIFLQTTGIVTLTLVINGTTSGMVYKALNVYPPNPFRPVLATQGLRNLQLEMDKFINGLGKHWFHCNADTSAVGKLFPNFSEAYMFDGDLIDVKVENIHNTWTRGIGGGASLSPLRMGIKAAEAVKNGVQVGLSSMRVGTNPVDIGEVKDAMAPDCYAEIAYEKGDNYQTFETSIVVGTKSPRWDEAGVQGETKFFIPDGDEPAFLYLHFFDNDLGENDPYLGQAKIPLDEMSGSSQEYKLELTPCTHLIKMREYSGLQPTAVSGEVTVRLNVAEPTMTVSLVKGVGLGVTDVDDSEKVGDHSHDGHGHGHGHGTSHMVVLKNVKRWIVESNEEVDPTHAMYEILLSAMRTEFIHQREGKIMSVRSYSRINACLGLGFDMNNEDMDALQKMDQLVASGSQASVRLAKAAIKDPSAFSTPIDTVVNAIIDYAEQGLPFGGTVIPSVWFEHRLCVGEMMLAMLSVLKDLADADPSELGEEFGTTLVASTDRLRVKLIGLQAEAPNTWKAVHTLIAFKATVSEFTHRVHMYQDQGFFDDTLSDAAMFCTETHVQNIQQYLHMDYLTVVFSFITGNACTADHPIVGTFKQDKAGIKGNFAANKNLGLDDEAVDSDSGAAAPSTGGGGAVIARPVGKKKDSGKKGKKGGSKNTSGGGKGDDDDT
jgi:NhaP-type Na+/H+ or K+/H+ antiporter